MLCPVSINQVHKTPSARAISTLSGIVSSQPYVASPSKQIGIFISGDFPSIWFLIRTVWGKLPLLVFQQFKTVGMKLAPAYVTLEWNEMQTQDSGYLCHKHWTLGDNVTVNSQYFGLLT